MKEFAEPLYPEIARLPHEEKLFQLKAVRRLKLLSHYGAGSLVSPIVHSRFEHTVGVWKLAAHFQPDNNELRVAAILHDIGHLPFSHSVEKALGFDHHELTAKRIHSPSITAMLTEANIDFDKVIAYLDHPGPLIGTNTIMGLDHLDSFLRDTYMAGTNRVHPWELVKQMECTESGVACGEETAAQLMELVVRAHEWMCSPTLLAADAVLAEAILCDWAEVGDDRDVFVELTDWDVLSVLKTSPSLRARMWIQTLLEEPHKLLVRNGASGSGIPISVRKLYAKAPLVNGKPYFDTIQEDLSAKLQSFINTYEVIDFSVVADHV
ncbi:metal dependent phosphohydrolase [Niallia circulans]|uniref:HD domain-containing protein n=1 Tax=Shouchella clausii TaxID=79880 RepID=UPI000BA4EF9F|nr:HD domain-containing protein [Shouchella clausii]SPU18465.1 metal dependent phosphohydrolase [Niallia circulans]MBU8598234.1 HD domain-containing protein [Shouchella clausii]MCY1106938.1 HD domain-containing protein [Shouchella clausii]MED4160305.1 HD domain-containing protein [Shouchella clausii]MED4178497.1 HD domain-containing protein [Shouchella clausii]